MPIFVQDKNKQLIAVDVLFAGKTKLAFNASSSAQAFLSLGGPFVGWRSSEQLVLYKLAALDPDFPKLVNAFKQSKGIVENSTTSPLLDTIRTRLQNTYIEQIRNSKGRSQIKPRSIEKNFDYLTQFIWARQDDPSRVDVYSASVLAQNGYKFEGKGVATTLDDLGAKERDFYLAAPSEFIGVPVADDLVNLFMNVVPKASVDVNPCGDYTLITSAALFNSPFAPGVENAVGITTSLLDLFDFGLTPGLKEKLSDSSAVYNALKQGNNLARFTTALLGISEQLKDTTKTDWSVVIGNTYTIGTIFSQSLYASKDVSEKLLFEEYIKTALSKMAGKVLTFVNLGANTLKIVAFTTAIAKEQSGYFSNAIIAAENQKTALEIDQPLDVVQEVGQSTERVFFLRNRSCKKVNYAMYFFSSDPAKPIEDMIEKISPTGLKLLEPDAKGNAQDTLKFKVNCLRLVDTDVKVSVTHDSATQYSPLRTQFHLTCKGKSPKLEVTQPAAMSTYVNAPTTSSFNVSNTGAGTLEYEITRPNPKPWLSLSPSSGTVGAGLNNTINLIGTCPSSPMNETETLLVRNKVDSSQDKNVVVSLECKPYIPTNDRQIGWADLIGNTGTAVSCGPGLQTTESDWFGKWAYVDLVGYNYPSEIVRICTRSTF